MERCPYCGLDLSRSPRIIIVAGGGGFPWWGGWSSWGHTGWGWGHGWGHGWRRKYNY